MKFNLGFLCLYNMIVISLEIEYFEYYYLFPLLKEILNYYGYTSKLNYLKNLTQQALINTYQLTKWGGEFHKYYNKFYYNIYISMIIKKKNQKLKKSIYNQYIYENRNIYENGNKKLLKKSFLYLIFKLIISYKKWKADELYIKMAHIAYCENIIDFPIKLFKMARFEKQTSFFLFTFLRCK